MVRVAFLPAEARHLESAVAVVIDTLRATTTLTAMIESGCNGVTLAATTAAARLLRTNQALLCGEEGGLKPLDFHRGNSPSEYLGSGSPEAELLFATTNGTRAIHHAASAPLVLAGSLRNRTAVAEAAMGNARHAGLRLWIVCAGRDGGATFALEDTYCAGAIVDAIAATAGLPPPDELNRGPADDETAPELAEGSVNTVLHDSALAAWQIYRAYLAGREPDSAAMTALSTSASGRGLTRLGLGDDVAFCALVDRTSAIARVERVDGTDLLRASPYRGQQS